MISFALKVPGFAAAALLLVPLTSIAQGPDPAKPFIQSITYGGTGCPQGTVGTSIANNRLSFTLIFDSFVGSSGPGVPVTEARKTCQVNLNLTVPAGSSTFVETTTARGYTQLPSGQKASVISSVSLANPAGKTRGGGDDDDADEGSGVSRRTQQADFKGPVAKDYQLAEGHSYTIQAPCNAPTSVRTLSLTYTVAAGSSVPTQITLDSLDGLLTVQKVRACGKDRD